MGRNGHNDEINEREKNFAGSEFLESLRTEVLNCSSRMNALTSFAKMTVKELFKLQKDIAESENDGEKFGKCLTTRERKGKFF